MPNQEAMDAYLNSIHFDVPEYGDDWEELDNSDPEDIDIELQKAADGEDIRLSTKVLLFNHDDKFLILEDAFSDWWDLPGGHVSEGELNIEGLEREVEEETQLSLVDIKEIFSKELTLGGELKAVVFYTANIGGNNVIQLSDEHTDSQWISMEESGHYNLGVFDDVIKEIFEKREDRAYDGGIVTFPVPQDIAEHIAIDGYEAPERLHITLAYIPYDENSDEDWLAGVKNAVEKTGQPPMDARTMSLMRWENDDEKDPFVLLVKIPGIDGWRKLLEKYVDENGLTIASDHNFNPHITLAYLDKDEKHPMLDMPEMPIEFEQVSIWMDDEHYDVNFDDEDIELKKQLAPAEAQQRGLEPQTGNWQKPGRWIKPHYDKPDEDDLPDSSGAAEHEREQWASAREFADKMLEVFDVDGEHNKIREMTRANYVKLEAGEISEDKFDVIDSGLGFINGILYQLSRELQEAYPQRIAELEFQLDENGKIQAYSSISEYGEEFHISVVSVMPDHFLKQGSGAGTRLMMSIVHRFLTESDAESLQVVPLNQHVAKYYRKFGFQSHYPIRGPAEEIVDFNDDADYDNDYDNDDDNDYYGYVADDDDFGDDDSFLEESMSMSKNQAKVAFNKFARHFQMDLVKQTDQNLQELLDLESEVGVLAGKLEDDFDIEKAQRGYHEHDGWAEHPVRVKDHQDYFTGPTQEDKVSTKKIDLMKQKMPRFAWLQSATFWRKVADNIPITHLSTVKSFKIHYDKEVFEEFNAPDDTPAIAYHVKGDIHLGANSNVADCMHEVGHAIHYYLYQKELNDEMLQAAQLFRAAQDDEFISEYAKTNSREFFAENYFYHLATPDHLRKVNPKMSGLMDRIDEILSKKRIRIKKEYDEEIEEFGKPSYDSDDMAKGTDLSDEAIELEKSASDDGPDWYQDSAYDWIDKQLSILGEDSIQKAGLSIPGDMPPGTKQVGKKVESSLYQSLQDDVDTYLGKLAGSETQQEVIDGTRKVIENWRVSQLPVMQAAFAELFKRGLAAGIVSVGGRLDIGDRFVLELLSNSEFRLGARIELFVEEIATRYTKVIQDSFGPNQEFNLPKLIADMNQAVPAQRYQLERIARTEVGQTSGLGKFWGWEQKPEEKYLYAYYWDSTPDKRRRKMKEIRSAGNPYTADEIWFLWSHNKQNVPGIGWQMGVINCRCGTSRRPLEEEFRGNRFEGQEGFYERTLDVVMPFEKEYGKN